VEDTLPPNYPSWWETHVVLTDGAPVELRPIRPSDRDLLDQFHKRQSRESVYFRFFRYRPELTDKELDFFTQIDYVDRMAFVALLGDELVAVARYEQVPKRDAPEVAFFVDDQHHGRGLATLMLEYLAAAARSHGSTRFTATVLPENYAMLGVFRRAGFGIKTRFEDGVIEVELDITITSASSSAIAGRERRSRSQSVSRLLRPRSVAVVGASRRPGHVGHELLRRLRDGGFTGELHAINSAVAPAPDGGSEDERILGVPTWRTLSAIGTHIDLVVVMVPAEAVEDIVAEAAVVGVCGLLVVSAGYSESGADGIERERRLVALARRNGMRLIGPNAFGLVNTDPEIQLEALFLPILPEPGAAGLMSQSGPLGSAVLDHMRQVGVGISSFVAAGNRADVSVNDLIEYWALDEATRVILLYVENYGNLRTFAELATDVSATKPIAAVRPGDGHLEELLEQSGVILVDGVSELADVAHLASAQPLPAGNRVAVITNAASVARLVVAACRRNGLEVVRPASVTGGTRTRGAEDTVLIGDVDTLSFGDASSMPDYEQMVVQAAVSDEVDSLLVAVVPTLELSLEALSELLERVNRSVDKPLVAVGLVDDDLIEVERLPVFTFPEEAARTLGRLTTYARWRREHGEVVSEAVEAEPETAAQPAAVPAAETGTTGCGGTTDGGHATAGDGAPSAGDGAPSALADPGSLDCGHPMVAVRSGVIEVLAGAEPVEVTLWSDASRQLVDLFEIPVAEWRIGHDLDEILELAAEIGFPVVLKAGGVAGRTVGEAGGTAIDLHDGEQVAAAYARMEATLGEALVPAAVQRMIPATANGRIDLIQDPDLGSFVQVGVGGPAGAPLGAVCRRFLPLTEREVTLLVDSLAATLPVDDTAREVVADMVRRLALLGAAVPELSRVRLDPVLVAGEQSVAADLCIMLRPYRSDPLAEVRRL
jgi:acyl-CoA synthetase (NDP forming)/RimJ/RimL family protein N-acetyltransferase